MNNIDYIKREVIPRTSYLFTKNAHWEQIPIKDIYPDIVNDKIPYIKYDPNTDFQYATSERIMTDGTLAFALASYDMVLEKVINARTYYTGINISKIKSVDDFQYIIGDIVQCIESGDFGTKEKPWLHERITTFLPIKMVIRDKK